MNNVKLDSTFDETATITKETSVRLSDDVSSDDAVTVHYTVKLSGATVREVVDNTFSVTLRNSKLKKSFADQDELRTWAEKNATKDKPYEVHIWNLGKVMSEEEKFDPETRKKMLIERMKSMGITADDLK